MNCELSKLFPEEKLWMTICSASGDPQYAVTTPSEYDRREYRIYGLRKNGAPKLLGHGPDPGMLERRYVTAQSLV